MLDNAEKVYHAMAIFVLIYSSDITEQPPYKKKSTSYIRFFILSIDICWVFDEFLDLCWRKNSNQRFLD